MYYMFNTKCLNYDEAVFWSTWDAVTKYHKLGGF